MLLCPNTHVKDLLLAATLAQDEIKAKAAVDWGVPAYVLYRSVVHDFQAACTGCAGALTGVQGPEAQRHLYA
jgi:NAD-dependent oxidoreductase involved in siderophore biosynthesis